jgi:hypothetical protein
MNPKDKANDLVDSYRIILMNEDTDCGEEILCTVIAKQCALIAVDEIIKERYFHNEHYKQNSKLKYHIEIELSERLEATRNYWEEVKHEIEKL